MKLAAIHALLLLATLGFAYQTWTRDKTGPVTPGSVLIWDTDVDDIVAIAYESDEQEVSIERREDETGTYFWGTVTHPARETPPSDTAGDSVAADSESATPDGDSAAPDTMPAAPTVIEFVVGQEGDVLLDEAADPRALRDLGTVDEQRLSEYGLADSTAKIVVRTEDATRELEVGGTAWGVNDRYVRDRETGRIYVLPAAFLRRLERAEYLLPERRLHLFDDASIRRVVVRTGEAERVMHRADGAQPGTAIWTQPEEPDEPDQTFANFMDRLDRIWASEYVPDLDPRTLTSVVRIDYFDASDRPLGHVELFRGNEEGEGVQYYARTELTRVLTRVNASLGEQLDADVSQLF
ncbi:MAG TPA: DUF4340 domain-containing protein [Longimicrobiaceae bacterium]